MRSKPGRSSSGSSLGPTRACRRSTCSLDSPSLRDSSRSRASSAASACHAVSRSFRSPESAAEPMLITRLACNPFLLSLAEPRVPEGSLHDSRRAGTRPHAAALGGRAERHRAMPRLQPRPPRAAACGRVPARLESCRLPSGTRGSAKLSRKGLQARRVISMGSAADSGDRKERDTAWHGLAPGEALDRLESRKDGLSKEQVERRQARVGPNELPEEDRPGLLRIYQRPFRDPLIYVLLIAGVLSLALDNLAN